MAGRMNGHQIGWALAATAILAVALGLRLPRLDQRPMHGDEANQAVRAGMLLEQGIYEYDPTDHHGPTLYYAALPFCLWTSRDFALTTEWNYRLTPVFFSCLTLLLMLGMARRNGKGLESREAMAWAALLTAVSPAMAYYARYFIQESLLVTFLTGMLLCAMRYVRARTAEEEKEEEAGRARRAATWWAAGFGLCAGLAAATKETVVLSYAAAAVALLAACGWRRLLAAWRTRDALVAIASAGGVATLFFSSFFTHPRGVYDAIFSTVSAYFSRATATPEHHKPWWFYLQTMFWYQYGRGPVWSEAGLLLPAALATVGAFVSRRGRATPIHSRWIRFVAVYTLALTAFYSAIPYKTPWCVLTFLHGYILLAGVGVAAVVAWLKAHAAGWGRFSAWGARLLALLLVCRHLQQAHRACFLLPADPRNPYVYAHTGMDAMRLVAAITNAAAAAQGEETPMAIAAPMPDTWPLPWYLRRFRQVGYWTRVDEIPADFKPQVIVVSADQGDDADERFGEGRRASFFGIRPGVLLIAFLPVEAPVSVP